MELFWCHDDRKEGGGEGIQTSDKFIITFSLAGLSLHMLLNVNKDNYK